MAFRTDAPGATAGNLYTEGNPSLGIPATVVSADAMNFLQEELVTLVEYAGIALDKNNNTQVRQAILSIAGDGTIDTTGYDRLTDSSATALDTLFAEIDTLLTEGLQEFTDMVDQVSDPAAPAASTLRIYQVGDILYQRDSAGNIKQLTNQASGTFPFTVETSNTALTVNTGVIANSLTQLEFSLPASAAVGDRVQVTSLNSGGWKITQGAGQSIIYSNGQTPIGVDGSLVGNGIGASAELVCAVANDTWIVVDSETPLVISGAGAYSMGGNTSNTDSLAGFQDSVESFDFGAESFSTIGDTLATARTDAGGGSFSSKGYIAGGQNNSPALISSIEGIEYSIDDVFAVSATLGAANKRPGAYESAIYIFFVGGDQGATVSSIQRLDTSEVRDTSSETLNTAKEAMANFANGTEGWDVGGKTGGASTSLTEIGKLTFSGETHALESGSLDVNTDSHTGVVSSTKGYAMGGLNNSGTFQDKIEDVDLSTGASTTITAVLTATTRSVHRGHSSATKGYMPGGGAPSGGTKVVTNQQLTFSGETISDIGAALNTKRNFHVNVQSA